MNTNKGFAPIIAIIIAVIVIGGGIYFATKNKTKVEENKTPVADLKSYINIKYGFSFQYPKYLNAYEWQPYSAKYSSPTLVTGQGTGNNIILSSLDYTDQNVDYGNDTSYIRIMEENGEAFIKNSTDAEDFWNKLGKYDDNGRLVNRFLEKKTINGTKFIIFEQYGWSVPAQATIWASQALFAYQGKFFWIGAGDSISKEQFNVLVNSFKFAPITGN